ncbi:DNA-binding response regulator [Planotetraspora silvatica]|jgi:two-component system response regulator MprA|uniref:DNA-binding response regulator n=1 Tax=Planotetraspora silvatica TaxID=234614 RepID=A0A8J3UPV6_9ACTN|nr:response regulator transcription factor [Planotetraspora silvatica]GII47281.1 DNA-binding response regulator [Planotetraspora silvatica]
MTATVAIVEDDSALRQVLSRGLREEGFEVPVCVSTGSDLLRRIDAAAPEVFIVDIGLPDVDGRDLCMAIRARGVEAPVLFLTARGSITDRLAGFHSGADDYLPKPFHFDELVVRLRALIRRSASQRPTPPGLHLDPATHTVRDGDRAAALTPTEFRILALLLARRGEVIRRRTLINAAWPPGAMVHDNTLDAYIVRLRRKLTELGQAGLITTIRGVGYSIS